MRPIGYCIVVMMLPALLAAPAARAQEVAGTVRIIDGDTLEFGFRRIDLWAADALERFQKCLIGANATACGANAIQALSALIGGQPVRCTIITRNRYNRELGRCQNADGIDINREMVRQGWAVADRRIDTAYVTTEAEARAAGAGAWQGRFIDPFKWRQGVRLPEHDIKKIYP